MTAAPVAASPKAATPVAAASADVPMESAAVVAPLVAATPSGAAM